MKRKSGLIVLPLFFASLLMFNQCATKTTGVKMDIAAKPFERLSEYQFFNDELETLSPNERVLPYEIVTTLFTDYAEKARFVWMPEGNKATYTTDHVLDFPIGTVLIKNFYYDHDSRDLSKGRRIIETRLLVKRQEKWDALTYVWNDAQTDATLKIAGGSTEVKWINEKGKTMQVNYEIPNKNQCKGCHEYDGKLIPIGPKVRNLNMDFEYADGKQNQLAKWADVGYLEGYNQSAAHPRVADWKNPKSGTLHERAMAYLDVNCGHCHNPNGPGGVSGLNLTYNEPMGPNLGICKSPVSAGSGSGGNDFDIYPGEPDKSILVYRMESTRPGEMMPEIGRMLVHTEGVALIKEWIAAMEGDCGKAIMN